MSGDGDELLAAENVVDHVAHCGLGQRLRCHSMQWTVLPRLVRERRMYRGAPLGQAALRLGCVR